MLLTTQFTVEQLIGKVVQCWHCVPLHTHAMYQNIRITCLEFLEEDQTFLRKQHFLQLYYAVRYHLINIIYVSYNADDL